MGQAIAIKIAIHRRNIDPSQPGARDVIKQLLAFLPLLFLP
jgi:hypothetical protein